MKTPVKRWLGGLLPVLAGAVLAAHPAAAAETRTVLPRFEVTPWGGYRFGGGFDHDAGTAGAATVDVRDAASFGVDVGIYRDGVSFYELLFATQSARLDTRGVTADVLRLRTDYYHLGGTLLFPQDNGLVTWLSATAGVTRFDPSGTVQGEALSSESDFSMSLGGGLRIPLNPHFSIVGGVRGYVTLLDPSSRIFCVSNGGAGCVFQLSGSSFFQFEGLVGLALTF